MKIVAVEIALVDKLLPIADGDRPRTDAVDQPFGFELLDGAVDVDRGQARGVAKLFLSHRQLVADFITKAGDLQPQRKFAKQMGKPSAGVAAADVGNPTPKG